MKIGIDLDDTTAVFMSRYLEYHNKRFGTSFSIEDADGYISGEFFGITSEEFYKYLDEFSNDYLLFENYDVVEGARESILTLANDHELFFITARPTYANEGSKKFIEKNFPNISYELHHSGDTHKGLKHKHEICKELGIGCMIDDSASVAHSCAENGFDVLLVDAPWNKDLEHENIKRVKGWKEIMEKINGN